MALKTNFYNLIKPLLSERFELKTWNKNMDLIDDALHSINERTNLSSPYIGTDVGNRVRDIMQTPINADSIKECIVERIINKNGQNTEFIFQGVTTSQYPFDANYKFIIQTFGLMDGDNESQPSKNILVKATEISKDARTYISVFNIENAEFVSICDDSSKSSEWEMIYPSKYYEDMKISSPNITLNTQYTIDSSNDLEGILSDVISSTELPFIQIIYENSIDDELPKYQLSISKFQENENAKSYRVVRYKMTYPYTIDFNNFDNETGTFSLDRWKLIYPADSMANLPDNVVTKEKDPIFLENLGKTVCKYYTDILNEADGSLEAQIKNMINSNDNFHFLFSNISDEISDVNVTYLSGENGDRVFSVISTLRVNNEATIAMNYYSEAQDRFTNEMPYVLYPFPQPFITDDMSKEISSIHDPLYEKTIAILGDDTCFAVDTSDDTRIIGYNKCLEKVHKYSDVILDASYGVQFTHADEKETVENKLSEFIGLDTNIDYCIIQATYYDYYNQVPIGEMTEGFDESEFNINTYAGAMEQCFYTALTNLSNTKFGFIILSNLREDTSRTIKLSEYYLTAKNICNKWQIPILDLREVFNINNPIMFNNFFDENGIELNKQGYERVSSKLDMFIKSL